jgi:hypothetical protein
MFVSTIALKKTAAKHMGSELSIGKIEEPRAICISVQCGKKDFKKLLKEAKEGKAIDITNGSKNKNVQKVVDYIKKVLQDKIGKDKLGNKVYAYIKYGSTSLLYVFAGVKQDALNETTMLKSGSLPDEETIKKAAQTAI